MNRVSLLLSGIAGATIILAAACGGGAPPPTPTSAPRPTATTAPAATTPSGGNGGGDPVARGKSLAESASPITCVTCHSTDGSTLVGPSWKGIYGHEVTLTDGSSVTVDDEYIRESIVDPNAKVVKDFPPSTMPQNYKDTLSDVDIEAIIAYIKSLQ